MTDDRRNPTAGVPQPRSSDSRLLTPDSRPVGVVVAMEAELRHLLERVGTEREAEDGVWRDRYTTVGGVPVVAVCCGIGMIDAAAGSERLINAHRPRAVLNFGCAGAHRRDIMPGDVIVGERVVHHSAVHILATGEELYRGGGGLVGGEAVRASEWATDPTLLGIAREAVAGFGPEPWPRELGWPTSVPYRTPMVHVGPVASADVWTQYQARLDLLHDWHGSLCEDMEAAAIGQVCALHGVPFLTIKDISNNEYHAATDIAGGFPDFPTAEVGKRAAALVLRVLELVGQE